MSLLNVGARALLANQVALQTATPKSQFVGSGKKVAAEIIRWIDEGAAAQQPAREAQAFRLRSRARLRFCDREELIASVSNRGGGPPQPLRHAGERGQQRRRGFPVEPFRQFEKGQMVSIDQCRLERLRRARQTMQPGGEHERRQDEQPDGDDPCRSGRCRRRLVGGPDRKRARIRCPPEPDPDRARGQAGERHRGGPGRRPGGALAGGFGDAGWAGGPRRAHADLSVRGAPGIAGAAGEPASGTGGRPEES